MCPFRCLAEVCRRRRRTRGRLSPALRAVPSGGENALSLPVLTRVGVQGAAARWIGRAPAHRYTTPVSVEELWRDTKG